MREAKGCFNEKCRANKKGIKYYKDSEEYCSRCGEELGYVCRDKCYNPLPNRFEKYCETCKVRRERKKEQLWETSKKIGPTVSTITAVGATLIGIGKKAITFLPKKK